MLKIRAAGPELNLKIKLQGDFGNITNPPIKAVVSLYTVEAKIKEFADQSLIQENQNVFSIKLSLSDIDLTKIYAVFIKPEKYLGRLFCSQIVVGADCRSPQLIFGNNQNNIDLSKYIFLSGDLKPFDGKVSSYDLSIIIHNLGKVASPSADTDINYDSSTDTQDYSLALYSLGQNVVDDPINFASSSATPTPIAPVTPTTKPATTNTPIPTPTTTTTIQPTPTQTPTRTPTPSPIHTPTPTPVASACSAMDNGLPNSSMRYPDGYTDTPATTKQIFNFAGTNNYSIPYRNPNCSLSQTVINNVYERIKSFYPNYWQQSKLLDDWETVQHYAKKYNFNPIFVSALWIEESAGGGATNAQKLGCVYRLNKNDTFTHMLTSSTICEQMECLFGLGVVYPQNYALYACQYELSSSAWVNNQCTGNPEFVKTVEFWYDFMSAGQPTECRAKYCPNAPGC